MITNSNFIDVHTAGAYGLSPTFLDADEKSMVNEEKVKIFVDELSKSCPMLDYQKELLIRAIVNGCHNDLPYELEMRRLDQLYYYREMTRRLRELLFF